MTRKSSAGAIIMLLFASIIWGGSFVVVKDSLDYVTPMWQLFYRLAAASIGGIVLFLMQIKNMKREYIFRGVIMGTIFGAALIFQNLGADLSTASKCAFLTVSYVAFTPIIGAVSLHKKLTLKKILTIVVCMTGVGLITLNDKLSLDIGDIFLLITGFLYAVHILWIDKCGDSGVLIIHIIQIWTALVMALLAALIFEPFSVSYEPRFIASIIYCGIFEILTGFYLQFKGQQNTSPTLAGIILSSECVFAGIFGVMFQNDYFGLKMAIGCLLIFVSAIMESLNFERKQ